VARQSGLWSQPPLSSAAIPTPVGLTLPPRHDHQGRDVTRQDPESFRNAAIVDGNSVIITFPVYFGWGYTIGYTLVIFDPIKKACISASL
jgi:hypothetical protein